MMWWWVKKKEKKKKERWCDFFKILKAGFIVSSLTEANGFDRCDHANCIAFEKPEII